MGQEIAIIITVIATILLGHIIVWIMKLVVVGPRCKQTPRPGERWGFSDKRGPWPSDEYLPVLIRDVQGGWVRYDMSMFKDKRMKVDMFVRMYRPV